MRGKQSDPNIFLRQFNGKSWRDFLSFPPIARQYMQTLLRESVETVLTNMGRRFPNFRLVTSPCFRYGSMIAVRGGALDRWAKLRDGSALHLSLEEAVFRHLYFFGHYEERVTDLMLHVVRPGQLWLDVGANVGMFSILLGRRIGPTGAVHAFEPNPSMAEHLRLSLQRNQLSNIYLHECALGDQPGEAQLHLPRRPDDADGGSGRGSLLPQEDVHDRVAITVNVSTLDAELADEHRPIFGMKIDVEGFESAVLGSASRLFRDRPPRVIFSEVTHRPEALSRPADLIAKYASLGYVAFRTDPFMPYCSGEPLDCRRDANMIFIHVSARELILAMAH
jgi:FkbM family methyltransferase